MNKQTLDQIKEDITTLAKTLFKTKATQAAKDGKAFLEATKGEIEKWLKQLAAGEISRKNFESLVRGERDLAEMEALRQAGMAKITIDTFTRGVIEIIISAVLKTV